MDNLFHLFRPESLTKIDAIGWWLFKYISLNLKENYANNKTVYLIGWFTEKLVRRNLIRAQDWLPNKIPIFHLQGRVIYQAALIYLFRSLTQQGLMKSEANNHSDKYFGS